MGKKMKRMKNILFGKAMGMLLAVSVMVSMAMPLSVNAAEDSKSGVEDNTNMFVGTINGEDVIGYLDKTYVYYLSGKDYNASYVIFDENGAPKQKIYIRINKDVPAGTYSSSGQDTDKVYLSAEMAFNATKQKFSDSYTFIDSDKDWTLELTSAQYADDGVFEGTVNGTCMAGRYNNSPSYTEVTISGSFNFQMQTIHPTMETYRAENPEYNTANETSYVQSFGTSPAGSSANGSGSSGSSSSVDHTCRTCGGTGSCQKCFGSGVIINSSNGKLQSCVRCLGSGKCAVCAGTGSVY